MSQQEFATNRRTDRGDAEPLAPANAPIPTPEIADPGPLGLAGFAMTTFVLSVFNAAFLPATLTADVLGLALFYGGIVQLLAGMWEFRKDNTFGALAFSSYGAFWLSFWYYITSVVPKLPAADAHNATGLYLLAWLIFTAYMTVASLRTTAAVAAVFVTLTLTYLFLTISEFATSPALGRIGGYIGLLTALLAWYASFAGVTNATYKRVVLPVRPLT
jgi:succinate-acetate transporter protein